MDDSSGTSPLLTSSEVVALVEDQMTLAVDWGVFVGTTLFVMFIVVSILRWVMGVSGDHQPTPSSQVQSANPYTRRSTPYTNLSQQMNFTGQVGTSSSTPLSDRLRH